MAKISIASFHVGSGLRYQGNPYVLMKVRSKHLGRGGAIYRVKMRNLKTGTILQKAFRPTDKFEMINLTAETMIFSYADKENAYFLHHRTYEQLDLDLEEVGDFVKYLKEGEKYHINFVDDKPIAFQPPQKITRLVIKAPEAVAGNTVNSAGKIITIEGGARIEAPLFIKKGDKIIIRIEDNTYVSKGS